MSPTATNKARAKSKPASRPTMEANCRIAPFMQPMATPKAIIPAINQSNGDTLSN